MKTCYYVIEGNCLPNNYVLIVSSNLGLNNTFFYIPYVQRCLLPTLVYLANTICGFMYLPLTSSECFFCEIPVGEYSVLDKDPSNEDRVAIYLQLVTARCFYLINELIL